VCQLKQQGAAGAKEDGRLAVYRPHFFRLFESSIGVPPRVYMNVLRMELR
jgi:hypothetical protein